MWKQNIIENVNRGIVKTLQKGLVPHYVKDEKCVGMCDPRDRSGYIVGVHLHLINPTVSRTESAGPAISSCTLHYMISVYNRDNPANEGRVIGKVMEILDSISEIPTKYMEGRKPVPFEMECWSPTEIEERQSKIWAKFHAPYKPSVFYMAGPIEIDHENDARAIKGHATTTGYMPLTSQSFKNEQQQWAATQQQICRRPKQQVILPGNHRPIDYKIDEER